ncbi:hypothetical protein COL55_13415 [Bacillus toyonensis]|nr:hypothetical protein CN624_21190 [Bacillus toyonensis]PFY49101.1 hypothetical protein COL55_13415 [Bacillus toyonensis]PHD51849.1 hypothetical protein COF75_07405 [Bacillus toyonensis]
MTAFMIYLLVGALWAGLCKLSGEIDRQLDEQCMNSLIRQLGITIVIILGWGPILVIWGLEKRKGE